MITYYVRTDGVVSLTRQDIGGLILAVACLCFFCGSVGYYYGHDAEADLTMSAISNADYATNLLRQCIDTGNQALAIVWAEDKSIWLDLMELPRIDLHAATP